MRLLSSKEFLSIAAAGTEAEDRAAYCNSDSAKHVFRRSTIAGANVASIVPLSSMCAEERQNLKEKVFNSCDERYEQAYEDFIMGRLVL